jgi:hypothetical protein
MGNIVKIAKKFLMSGPFYNDGFEYQFISVEDDLYDAIKFTVNVLLPKKGQSFVVEKFSYDIADIIENMSKFIGQGVSYSENIIVEGRTSPEEGLYLNDEDCDEIIRALNENVKYVEVSNDKDTSSVRANISFSRNKERNKFYLMDAHQYIDIFLKYNISNFEYNDVPVNVNLKTIDEFAEVFNEKLQNSDRFRDKLQDIIYRVLEPSLQIEYLEVYYNAQYWIDKVEGIEVHSTGNSFTTDFTPEMFNQTS